MEGKEGEDKALNELQTNNFDYSLLDTETADFLKDRENSMKQTLEKTAQSLGEDLSKARDKLSNHYKGTFEKWYTALGFKKQSVYNYINRYEYVVQQLDNQSDIEKFQELPVRLQNEMSKKTAKDEVNQAVFDGDITTHKEYKEMEKRLKKAEQAKRQAERQAEQAQKSEEIALKKLEEVEGREPEVITQEVVKEVVPEDVKRELEHMRKMVKLSDSANKELREELDTYKLKDTTDYDEKAAEWELKKLQNEADRNATQVRLSIKQLNNQIAISKYMYEAISVSSDYEKNEMKKEIGILKDIISGIEASLQNRKVMN